MFTCNICQNTIKNNKKFTTRCHHEFCNSCITHWLLLKNNCPMCRNNIVEKSKKYEDQDEDSEEDDDYIDYYIEWPETTNYLSFNELQDIRKKYREDIYDMCDDMLDDINDNYLEDIAYNQKYNFYETEDEIDTKQKIIYVILKFYPDSEKIKVKFVFKNKLKYPKKIDKQNYINKRGKILNKKNTINTF